MKFVKYFLQKRSVTILLLALVLAGGLFSYIKMGKLEDAPFTIKQALVLTPYPGASPSEVQTQVTDILEEAIQSMGELYYLKTENRAGLSKITVYVKKEIRADEMQQLWDKLRRKVNDVQGKLPAGAGASIVNDDFGDVLGVFYGLTGDNYSFRELEDEAKLIKNELLKVKDVAKVEIYGVQTPTIDVTISPAVMAQSGVTTADIAHAFEAQNKVVDAGGVDAGSNRIRIESTGNFYSLDDIRELTIVSRTGEHFRLADIANIEESYQNPPGNIMRIDGSPAVGIAISTVPTGNVVDMAKAVQITLDKFKETMPEGFTLTAIYDQGYESDIANQGFILNLIISVLTVVAILLFFIGFKNGILIGSGLVFSIFATLIVMMASGIALQRMSLAAIIIAMGMLVDNAIVVTDNAQIAIARGVNRRKALIDGATGPQWGLLGATFIAICSFLPLYLAPSAVAEIVKPLFVVLAISLGLSWVLALTQTTVFGNFILKAKTGDSTKDPYDKPFYHKFASVLGVLIRKKAVTLVSMVILFIISLIIMGTMPQNFFPSLDKPYFRADVFYPDGYSINDVVKEMKSVEEHLAKQPEVKKVSITFGSTPLRYYLASTSVGPKPNFANVLVELTDSKYTKEYEEDFDGYMKANYPSAITRTSLFKLSPAVDAAIEIGFIGPNVDTLVSLTNQAIAIMHQNPDLINIRNSWGNKIPVWKPVYSPERAQPLGVSRQGMAQSIQIGTTGMTLGEYRQGDQVLPILLKNNQLDSFRINDLRTLPVFGTGNETTSLEQVVSEFDFQYRFSNVKDYNRQMVMMAQCDPRRGTNAISAFNQVWSQVQQEIKIPEGYTMKYFGEQESQVESNEALAKNLPLTFFLMFVTLLFLFKTYRKPTVILLMLPLIFIGIVLGLLVLGKSFDFFSILGLLGLIGMNIKNAIVLVDQIDLETAAGKKPLDAVISATTSRIIPVAMASGTTILGMLPLLFDAMFGGMAATIMGGLLVASALTLFVLPVAYCAIHRIKGEQ